MTDDHGLADAARAHPDPASERGDDLEPATTPATSTTGAADDTAGATIEVPDACSVLVTGGGGFIGSHLVDALAPHADVRVLDTFETGSRSRLPEEATAIEGDVRDRAALSEVLTDVDVVVHLAAQVSVEESLEHPRESSETNVSATLDLLEFARREDARVVLASSAAIYGDPESLPVHETDPKRPESPYGVDKLAADNYARVYGARFGVPVVVLRYFNVYGPGANAGVVQTFAERAVAGEPLVVHGDGEQTRDFVHVDDVVRATLLAMATDHVGEAYNVGTGDRVSISRVAALIRDGVDGRVPLQDAPPRSGDVEHSQAAIDRARSRLGYEPRIELEDGISSVIAGTRERR